MQRIDLNLLKELTAVKEQPCISIYMPTHRVHPDSATDAATFKNIYRKTLRHVQELGLSDHEKLLAPLGNLVDDKAFWDNGGDGLAILASAEKTTILRLPERVEEIVCLADSFCAKPLFKLYYQNQHYHLLALNLDDVALYRTDKYHIEEVDIKGKVPLGMKEALGKELTDNHLHGSVVEGAGLHGYMEKSQEEDIDMERFFREVDRSLSEHFTISKDSPLLLAALPEHHSHFLRITKCQHLSPLHIQINPQALDKAELLEKVQEVSQEIWEDRKKDLLDRYGLALSENLASSDTGDVVRDAIDGKVELLCMEAGRSIDGHIDVSERKIVDIQEMHTDLLNELACLVFNYGGSVLVLDKADMPVETGVFTINRY